MFVYGMNEQAKGLALDALTGTRCTVGARDSEFISSATWKQCLDLDQKVPGASFITWDSCIVAADG